MLTLLSQITNPAISANIGTPGDFAGKLAGFIAVILKLGLVIAAVMSLVYLLWGAFEWVVSGGDKTNLENARNKIVHSVIGLAIVALLIAIAQFVGGFLQINLLNLPIPTADQFTKFANSDSRRHIDQFLIYVTRSFFKHRRGAGRRRQSF
ncbi:hypothetical protein HY030_02490 [Candidatus Gottesmanbacteria bacterium]|nr:hypothetical protein [Candidatus Gottesmanbacteria bacterium]